MGYQSKTWSLSDEVVEAVERAKDAGYTPNKFLRVLLGLDAGGALKSLGVISPTAPLVVDGQPQSDVSERVEYEPFEDI